MKVFLDIDGVMIPANSWQRPEILSDGFPAFSLKAVRALQKILSDTNADIILTSSHKWNYTLEQWLRIFRLREIAIQSISRLPENIERLGRREELLKWFDTCNRQDNFVIIDDDKSLNALPPLLKSRLILTSGSIGLTDELADEAIGILNNKRASSA